MKHLKQLFVALLLLCSTTAGAHDFEVDGIYYSITSAEELTVAVTFKGTSYSEFSDEYAGDVVIPETVTYNDVVYSVTSIGSSAFFNCLELVSLEIPESVVSIGSSVVGQFNYSPNVIVYVNAFVPASIESNSFSGCVFIVPNNSVDTYKEVWSYHADYITGNSDAVKTIVVEAKENSSGVLETIGLDKVGLVVDLTVKGSINSYDVIQLRDKMPLLRELDLSEAKVVASSKAFYNDNTTNDDDLGDYAFYGLKKLIHIKLPKDLVSIGNYMFCDCRYLRDLEIPSNVKYIGDYAFAIEPNNYNFSYLKTIKIPNGVKELCSNTFYYSQIENVILPDGLEKISDYVFYRCGRLKNIKLPPTVKKIGKNAFYFCSSLEEIRIPSSVEIIGSSAFSNCRELSKVYTYTVEPTTIEESTFSTFGTATLYVPSTSYWNYYWDEGWKRFLNLEYFDEPYEYFYLNNDYTLDDETGYIDGTPDADLNAGSGIIIEGEQSDAEEPNQSLGDVNIGHNGAGTGGSIIADNNLHVDNLNIRINVKGGCWYFFAFPFDIPFENISMENGSDFVFRYYDGAERANKGNGGWKDINENHLKAARGYIFQCSANDVLVLSKENIRFKKEDRYNELVAHVSENLKDASWNFTGNPYLSYYDIADLDYTAPVTVWDGEKYVAIRPGDDDYHFAPYEAFFVQKPEGKEHVGFDADCKMTYTQSQSAAENAALRRSSAAVNPERLLVNLVVTGGEASDRTRVVFNENSSLEYELECDATKFESNGVVQLYTIGNNVKYAINERPAGNGAVLVGYTAPLDGFYTIEVQRMDTPVMLRDNKTGTVHNLSEGAYSFGSDAGTFNDRFEIVLATGTGEGTTGIGVVETENGEVRTVYDIQGRKVEKVDNGVYIVDGEKVLVK